MTALEFLRNAFSYVCTVHLTEINIWAMRGATEVMTQIAIRDHFPLEVLNRAKQPFLSGMSIHEEKRSKMTTKWES